MNESTATSGAAGAAPVPVEVRRLRDEKRLRVTWDDGAVTEIDYRTVRGYCPCAGCQGHLVREIVFKPPRGEVDLFVIEPVGHYALSFLWSDGHHTGIYRYEFLRTLPERNRLRLEREARREQQESEGGPDQSDEEAAEPASS